MLFQKSRPFLWGYFKLSYLSEYLFNLIEISAIRISALLPTSPTSINSVGIKIERSGFDEVDDARFCLVLIGEGSTGVKVTEVLEKMVVGLARGLGDMVGGAELRRSIRFIFRRWFVVEQHRTSSVHQCWLLLTQFSVHFRPFPHNRTLLWCSGAVAESYSESHQLLITIE